MGMDTKLLKQKILDLAIRGKLVPQDPNDEPASALLERIRAEREKLIAEGILKRTKTTTDNRHYQYDNRIPFEIPKSWMWTTLEYVCSKIGSGSTPKGSNYSTNGIPFFRSQNVYNEGLVFYDIKYISEEIHQQMISTEVLPNDVLLNITGASLGRCAVVPSNFKKGNVSQHVCILRPIVVLADYLHCFILSSFFSKEMKVTGSGREGLPKYNLEKMLLPIPPLFEQERIVAEIKRWFSLINEIETDKQDLLEFVDHAKSKVLDLAMHGKLVPQDPSDEPAIELLKRINPSFAPCDTSQYENLPQGWVVCKLEDIVDYEQPTQYLVQSTNYSDNYKTPVLTAGKSFILGYTNETTGIFDELPTIIFDDFTTDSRFVDFPFKVKSSAMKILQVNKEINIRYVAYFMSITRLVGDTHKRYWISEYSKITIPLPPIKEQNRIVQAIQDIEAKLNEITTEL